MPRSNFQRTDFLLGALFLFLALVTLFVWIPLDIDTGLVERVRRRNIIGDSLGPVAAMILIGCAAFTLMRSSQNSPMVSELRITLMHFGFYIAVFAVTLLVMRLLGPWLIMAVDMGTQTELSYRNLRNIWPLKYVGYVAGGTILLSALSHFMDQSVTLRRIFLFFAISLGIALFFDLPFEDILLPPNGDV